MRRAIATLRPATGFSRPDGVPFDPFETDGLTVRCETNWPNDPADWDALSRRVPEATAFHSPEWVTASWSAGNIRGRLRFITVSRGQRLLAVVPMCVDGLGSIHTFGASISDYLEPLVDPESAEACWRAILAFLAALWDSPLEGMTFHNIRRDSPCRTWLAGLAGGAGFTCEEIIAEHSPVIELPSSWEAYLDSLDAHERKETRRKLNKAETKGSAKLGRVTDEAEIPVILATAISMMESVGGEKGTAVTKYVRPLLESAGPGLIRKGRIELRSLEIQGRMACCLIEFPTTGGPLLYNIGYDASLKEWSPGIVAVAMSIREAIGRGAKSYDLLRGREPYKRKIGGVDRPVYRLDLKR